MVKYKALSQQVPGLIRFWLEDPPETLRGTNPGQNRPIQGVQCWIVWWGWVGASSTTEEFDVAFRASLIGQKTKRSMLPPPPLSFVFHHPNSTRTTFCGWYCCFRGCHWHWKESKMVRVKRKYIRPVQLLDLFNVRKEEAWRVKVGGSTKQCAFGVACEWFAGFAGVITK